MPQINFPWSEMDIFAACLWHVVMLPLCRGTCALPVSLSLPALCLSHTWPVSVSAGPRAGRAPVAVADPGRGGVHRGDGHRAHLRQPHPQ